MAVVFVLEKIISVCVFSVLDVKRLTVEIFTICFFFQLILVEGVFRNNDFRILIKG